MSQAAIDT
jgi:hypothetical protein